MNKSNNVIFGQVLTNKSLNVSVIPIVEFNEIESISFTKQSKLLIR